MSEKLNNISVVIPTLNCRYLLEPVIGKLREIASLTGEVIVVDSYSEDGSLEYLREHLDHPNVQFHSRPKGLYAAWNYGIQQCTKKWVYIATAGDIIDAEDLMFLHSTASECDVDVVCAPPAFVDERGDACEDHNWPIFEILEKYQDQDLISLSSLDLTCFAVRRGRPSRGCKGWLGSSASNLYRSDFLQKNPFTTKVGNTGDSYWSIENASKVRAVFCRRRCGRFVIHGQTESKIKKTRQEIIDQYMALCWRQCEWIVSQIHSGKEGREVLSLVLDLLDNENRRMLEVFEIRATAEKVRKKAVQLRGELGAARQKVPRLFHRLVFPKDNSL